MDSKNCIFICILTSCVFDHPHICKNYASIKWLVATNVRTCSRSIGFCAVMYYWWMDLFNFHALHRFQNILVTMCWYLVASSKISILKKISTSLWFSVCVLMSQCVDIWLHLQKFPSKKIPTSLWFSVCVLMHTCGKKAYLSVLPQTWPCISILHVSPILIVLLRSGVWSQNGPEL